MGFRSFGWILVFTVIFIGCGRSGNSRADKLKDTIEKLRKKADFKPLDEKEAYAFINNYYLPRLDTLPTKRKIAIHPLTGFDFKKRFDQFKADIEGEFSDVSGKRKPDVVLEPPFIKTDDTYSWDSRRLINTMVLRDTIKYHTENHFKEWHEKYGYGYVVISYPQYNANTNRLVIREWTEDYSSCGTGRERTFDFKKTASGWEAY